MDSFQIFLISGKTLIAFLVATLLPLTLVALVSYHVSYNLARDRITNSALMSDEQLIFQLNSRLNQTEENVADTIQYQMYAFEHSSPRSGWHHAGINIHEKQYFII